MQSELLYTTSQAYLSDTIVTAGTGDSSLRLYGRGEGSVDWGGESGTIEWTNFPDLRPDGLFTPNVTGVIRLGDAAIMYRMAGISLEPDDAGIRHFVGSVQWWTEATDYLWLNKRFGLEEGAITPDGALTSRVYDVTPA